MTFHIITIFPNIFDSYFKEGIIARAVKKGVLKIEIHNLRDFTSDRHRTVDDTPYGGGPGMVLKIQPIYDCVFKIKKDIAALQQKRFDDLQFSISPAPPKQPLRLRRPGNFQKNPKVQILNTKTILFSAKGEKYNQKKAMDYSKLDHLIMICGRYEGVDERVARNLVDEEVSIGDYILTGGEIPAMALVDSVGRLIDGALGNPKSLDCETFNGENAEDGSFDYPVYTKPEAFRGWKVPSVLLSGNHGKIEIWRTKKRKK